MLLDILYVVIVYHITSIILPLSHCPKLMNTMSRPAYQTVPYYCLTFYQFFWQSPHILLCFLEAWSNNHDTISDILNSLILPVDPPHLIVYHLHPFYMSCHHLSCRHCHIGVVESTLPLLLTCSHSGVAVVCCLCRVVGVDCYHQCCVFDWW